jgi:signal peptidase I
MTKKEQRTWLSQSPPGAERERLLALREETLLYKQPRAARLFSHRARKKRSPMQKLAHIGFSLTFWVLAAGLIAIVFGGFQARREGRVPAAFGFSILRVETGSMVPTLPIGSFVITRAPADPAALPVGAIVTFHRSDGMVVTHRIIDIIFEDGAVFYQTRGDNPENAIDPELLTPDRVIGAFAFKITLPSIWGGQ